MSIRRSARTRRNRRGCNFAFALWLAAAAAGCALLAVLFCIPSVRRAFGQGERLATGQVEKDFGSPATDSHVLVVRLLDNSGSSRNTKKVILDQLDDLADIPDVSAQTYVWRYASQEEIIYNGINQERLVRPALHDYYEMVPPPATRGTNLGLALKAADATIVTWKRTHQNGVIVLTIGTDGGVEDAGRARIVASHLAALKDVYCFVHGVLVEQRLTEQISDALRPLNANGRLVVCNKDDFMQKEAEFGQAIDRALQTRTTGGRASP